MLRAYGPGCDGGSIDAAQAMIPDGASWIDLETPTREEELLVERCIGLDLPTIDDLQEIEPSSRLYERNGTLYMTVSALTGITEGKPTTAPVAFFLTDERLVTLRYTSPKPIYTFVKRAEADPSLVASPIVALIKLLDSIIDRTADELEWLGTEIEDISDAIFDKKLEARRIPADKLTALLTRIGRAQTLAAKVRYSAVSTRRLLNFLASADRLQGDGQAKSRGHLASLTTDIISLSEHATFQSDHLEFLLDASLGLISIEQNAAMKVFSWAAVVFLPPTLIAGVYGMNFHYFPELDWHYGYYIALGLMLASAILPYLFFKWRRWI